MFYTLRYLLKSLEPELVFLHEYEHSFLHTWLQSVPQLYIHNDAQLSRHDEHVLVQPKHDVVQEFVQLSTQLVLHSVHCAIISPSLIYHLH